MKFGRAMPFLLATAGACGGHYPAAGKPGDQAQPPAHAAPTMKVEDAALPYVVLRGHGGSEVAADGLWGELAAAQAICVGETHDNPHDHWAQLQVVDRLSQQDQQAGITLAVGMEMFQRPFQGVLDDFSAGRIDEAALLDRSDWKDRWGFDFALYRPMITLAVSRGASLLALNIETELRKKISADGVDALPASERARVPELVLDDAEHRAWFDGLMAEMGGAHGHSQGGDGDHGDDKAEDPAAAKATADRIYATQVLWDETMADTAARWVTAGEHRQVIILAGTGHCHDSAIVRRMKRRGVAQVVSVHPVVDDGDGNVAALLAEPQNDYLLVMRPAK